MNTQEGAVMSLKRLFLQSLVRWHPAVMSRMFYMYPFMKWEERVDFDALPRPYYAFGVLRAAQEAQALGIPEISVIEFGVSQGKGLLVLEKYAKKAEQATGVKIAVFGFDGGVGLPPPSDYRDLPFFWSEGMMRMNEKKLRSQLQRARLFVGDVKNTIPAFIRKKNPPIGFISFDLDYYSSTKNAFRLFKLAKKKQLLPRVYCYMDDITGDVPHSEYTGELLAIKEYNQGQKYRPLCPFTNLKHVRMAPQYWNEQIYCLHNFKHPQYNQFTGGK